MYMSIRKHRSTLDSTVLSATCPHHSKSNDIFTTDENILRAQMREVLPRGCLLKIRYRKEGLIYLLGGGVSSRKT
jgi:hypothetical protein